jgi:small conductance mechanosensitive channel
MFLYISSIKNYSTEIFNAIVSYAPKLIAAFTLLIIGIYSIKFVNKLVQKVMQSRQLDPTF